MLHFKRKARREAGGSRHDAGGVSREAGGIKLYADAGDAKLYLF